MRTLLILLLCCSLAFATQISQEQVGASTDDCAYVPGTSFSATGTTASIGCNVSGVSMYAGFRFTTVPIPAGSIIDTVILTGNGGSNQTTTTVNWSIICEDTADATTFSDSTDFTARNKTTATYYWANLPSFSTGTDYRVGGSTGNCKDPFVELFARADWASNNDVVVFIKDSGSTTNRVRLFRTYNNTTSPANTWGLKLDIYYTTPAGVQNVYHGVAGVGVRHSIAGNSVLHKK